MGVEIASLFGAKGVGEQFDEQILSTTARDRAIGMHKVHLSFLVK